MTVLWICSCGFLTFDGTEAFKHRGVEGVHLVKPVTQEEIGHPMVTGIEREFSCAKYSTLSA